VYSVTGRWDLIVKVRVARNEDLADVVTGGIDQIEGIRGSETQIAFRSYSEEALDAGFALGDDPDGVRRQRRTSRARPSAPDRRGAEGVCSDAEAAPG
jgi:hypothetical protein